MGVYIPNMEMPESCQRCPLLEEGRNGDPDWCRAAHCIPEKADCPLIPVPEHGRLIDADALPWDDPIHSVRLHGGEQWISAYKIATAPTIIPADKEGEEC